MANVMNHQPVTTPADLSALMNGTRLAHEYALEFIQNLIDGGPDGNHVENTIAKLEEFGYSSYSWTNVYMERHSDHGSRIVNVNGHDNGGIVVLVNPIALVPVLIINRQTGEVNIWA